MPAKLILADEVNDSRTVDVFKSGALEIGRSYLHTIIASGQAGGVAVNAPCRLHSVIIPSSATGAIFMLGDVPSACASAINTETAPSSALAYIQASKTNTYIFDTICYQTLCYRLTGAATNGITVTYQLI